MNRDKDKFSFQLTGIKYDTQNIVNNSAEKKLK